MDIEKGKKMIEAVKKEVKVIGAKKMNQGFGMGTIRREYKNHLSMEFDAISSNESFARVAVAAFIAPLNPTMEEISDVKTAVSEAVTNAIIHAYEDTYGRVFMRCEIEGDVLTVEIEDKGKGIENLVKAMEPLYTTKPELERSGMGFAFMEAFMDDLQVDSTLGIGTRVRMKKKLGTSAWVVFESED